MTINDWMKSMRLEFGMFEFKAISPQGHAVKSENFDRVNITGEEFIPQIQWKAENDRLADVRSQHPAKTPAAKGKRKTRQAP